MRELQRLVSAGGEEHGPAMLEANAAYLAAHDQADAYLRDHPGLVPVYGTALAAGPAPDAGETEVIPNMPFGWLSPEEEDYRKRAEAAVRHYTSDYGLEVFPLWWVKNGICQCPAGKDCDSPGKHPMDRQWPAVATSDPDQAARWWRPRPDETLPTDWRPWANIGVVMGVLYFILDVDTDGGKVGDYSLSTLLAFHGEQDLR